MFRAWAASVSDFVSPVMLTVIFKKEMGIVGRERGEEKE
jgi:hypothetical protein